MVGVPPDANPQDDPDDLAALAAYGAALIAAIEVALPAWVLRCVTDRWTAFHGDAPPPELLAAAAAAAATAVDQVVPELRTLLALDVAVQPTNPLALVRRAVVHPTRVLAEAGIPPVVRDAQAERMFPDDAYDLVPGAFADLDPAVHDPGLHWGAAKAHVLLRRRREAGPRR
jgi:hypothetical protein